MSTLSSEDRASLCTFTFALVSADLARRRYILPNL
jgi:hypothetical protein